MLQLNDCKNMHTWHMFQLNDCKNMHTGHMLQFKMSRNVAAAPTATTLFIPKLGLYCLRTKHVNAFVSMISMYFSFENELDHCNL